MRMVPPAAAILLTLLVLTHYHGDARPHLRDNTCFPPGEELREALILLRNVGSMFPTSCHFDNNNVTLPSNISFNHNQCSSVLRLVYEGLQGAKHVFQQQQPHLGEGGVLWDDSKLENFQNLLHRILRHHCFSQMNSSGMLEPYFSDITALLHKQDVCGWYVLRRDLLRILMNSLRKHHQCYSWTIL